VKALDLKRGVLGGEERGGDEKNGSDAAHGQPRKSIADAAAPVKLGVAFTGRITRMERACPFGAAGRSHRQVVRLPGFWWVSVGKAWVSVGFPGFGFGAFSFGINYLLGSTCQKKVCR
jgi:hypothetical protein